MTEKDMQTIKLNNEVINGIPFLGYCIDVDFKVTKRCCFLTCVN